MNKHARAEVRDVSIGLAVVSVLIAVLAVVFGPGSIAGASTYKVDATFGQSDGLSVGSPVRAAGVTVGNVAALALVDGFRVRVTLEIQSDVVMDSDASAAIVTDGIFGSKLVRIDVGGGEKNISDGGVIAYTEDALVIDDLLSLIISQARSKRAAEEAKEAEATETEK
jgi:phospholipid/cholesterol/gamma-HCH transport system substrate-binding protein